MNNSIVYTMLFFGNKELLDLTCEQNEHNFVATLDLFGEKGDMILPWNCLLTQGYASVKNQVWDYLKYNTDFKYFYSLGVGKQVRQIKEINPNETAFWCAFDGVPNGVHPNHRWIKCSDPNAYWLGHIHEELRNYRIGNDTTFIWSKINYTPKLTDEYKIATVYRFATRVHWLTEFQSLKYQQGTNKAWLNSRMNKKTITLYKTLRPLFWNKSAFLEKALELYPDIVNLTDY
jgi:hypothetical protein